MEDADGIHANTHSLAAICFNRLPRDDFPLSSFYSHKCQGNKHNTDTGYTAIQQMQLLSQQCTLRLEAAHSPPAGLLIQVVIPVPLFDMRSSYMDDEEDVALRRSFMLTCESPTCIRLET